MLLLTLKAQRPWDLCRKISTSEKRLFLLPQLLIQWVLFLEQHMAIFFIFTGNQISLLPLTLNFTVIGFKLSQQMMEFFHSLTSKMVKHKKNGVKSYPQSWLKVILQMLNMDYHSNYWKFITLLKRHSNGVLQYTVVKGCLLF